MTFRLDFNHGALEDANDPRARDISERINAHIDAAPFRARSEEEKREHVSASAKLQGLGTSACDRAAIYELIGSHLRLVVKIARGFAGYGLPLADLVAEGNVGLMQAAEKFEPARGFRFASYAVWWIRAAIAPVLTDAFAAAA
jgi:DNA-directed RNA polymerase sigma subunit (sigma70/sigma32)